MLKGRDRKHCVFPNDSVQCEHKGIVEHYKNMEEGAVRYKKGPVFGFVPPPLPLQFTRITKYF